jgi:hypothetical protein
VRCACDLCAEIEAEAVEHEFELREDETGSGGSAAFLRSRPARRLPGWG